MSQPAPQFLQVCSQLFCSGAWTWVFGCLASTDKMAYCLASLFDKVIYTIRSREISNEKYISESLPAGLICPSSSSVGVGFFFVSKKMAENLRDMINKFVFVYSAYILIF